MCSQVLALVVEDQSRYQLGKTKVFFRAFLLESLEKRRSDVLSVSAVVLQKRLKGLLCQQRFRLQRSAAVRVETAQRRNSARRAFRKQCAAIVRMQAGWRGRRTRQLVRHLRAAVCVQAAVRALLARRRTVALRRKTRATSLQASVRRRAQERRFRALRGAALRLQSAQRMVSQRKQYRRELAEKKEEAKLSTQLAKMQARLQAEIEARQNAEQEQERLRAERMAGGPAPPAAVEGEAASSSHLPPVPAAAVGEAPADDAADPTQASLSGRLAGAAAKYLSGYIGTQPQATSSIEETSAMLSLVTKDREKLSQRLAAETDIRKRLESEKRELERKLRLGSATNQLETRKAREMNDALGRKKDEMTELRQMLQRQTIEITNLQAANAAKDKRLQELERKMSQYDVRSPPLAAARLEAQHIPSQLRVPTICRALGPCGRTRSIPSRRATCAIAPRWRRWAKRRGEQRTRGPSTATCLSRHTSGHSKNGRSCDVTPNPSSRPARRA